MDLYEKNDSIPDEIEDLIDDYADFFRCKSMDPVNQEMMIFYEDDCIWVGNGRYQRGKKGKRPCKKEYEDEPAWVTEPVDLEEP